MAHGTVIARSGVIIDAPDDFVIRTEVSGDDLRDLGGTRSTPGDDIAGDQPDLPDKGGVQDAPHDADHEAGKHELQDDGAGGEQWRREVRHPEVDEGGDDPRAPTLEATTERVGGLAWVQGIGGPEDGDVDGGQGEAPDEDGRVVRAAPDPCEPGDRKQNDDAAGEVADEEE